MRLPVLVGALLFASCATAPAPRPEPPPPEPPPLEIVILPRDDAPKKARGDTPPRETAPQEAPAASAPSPDGTLPVLGRGAFPEAAPEPEGLDRAQTMSVHFLDVGQGSATLFELPCGAVLIDTGGEDNGDFDAVDALITQLDAFFARRKDLKRTIDLLVLTHPHIDHVRGVPAVLARYTVKNVVDNGQPGAKNVLGEMTFLRDKVRAGIAYRAVNRDDVPEKGLRDAVIDPVACMPVDPLIRVLSGSLGADPGWREKKSFANANNHSVVVRVDFGDSSVLVTGDLEEPAIDDLVLKYSTSKLLDVDVYVAGHHGSYNGTTTGLVSAMTPEVAVISMGAEWRHQMWTAWAYGHPREQAVTMLREGVTSLRKPRHVQLGIGARRFVESQMEKAVYATGWDGPVVIDMNANGEVVPRTPTR